MMLKREKPKKQKPGPPEERVKIDVPWEEAMGKAVKKPKPKGGWPKPNKDE